MQTARLSAVRHADGISNSGASSCPLTPTPEILHLICSLSNRSSEFLIVLLDGEFLATPGLQSYHQIVPTTQEFPFQT